MDEKRISPNGRALMTPLNRTHRAFPPGGATLPVKGCGCCLSQTTALPILRNPRHACSLSLTSVPPHECCVMRRAPTFFVPLVQTFQSNNIIKAFLPLPSRFSCPFHEHPQKLTSTDIHHLSSRRQRMLTLI